MSSVISNSAMPVGRCNTVTPMTGYPLILYFRIPCVFPVQPQIFPVPLSIICDCYINTKLTWQTYAASGKKWKFLQQILQYPLPLASGNLQLEQTKFPMFSLYFGKIFKFPVFSLTGNFLCHFPCAVGTLLIVVKYV